MVYFLKLNFSGKWVAGGWGGREEDVIYFFANRYINYAYWGHDIMTRGHFSLRLMIGGRCSMSVSIFRNGLIYFMWGIHNIMTAGAGGGGGGGHKIMIE